MILQFLIRNYMEVYCYGKYLNYKQKVEWQRVGSNFMVDGIGKVLDFCRLC